MPRLTNPIFTSHRRETISEVKLGWCRSKSRWRPELHSEFGQPMKGLSCSVPVEIIHATKSSDGVADNIYHCWLLHSKIGEIQIILMFQQNIFLIAFHLLRFHVIY